MASRADIVKLKTELEGRDGARNASYDKVLAHYGGGTYRSRKREGFWRRVTSAFNRRAEDEDINTTTPINLVRPTILSKIAYMGLPPTTRVPEPPMDDEDAAIEFADRQEKAYLGLQAASNFPRRCYDMAWFQGAMGGAAVGVWPDIGKKRPRIFVRGPQNFYVVPYDDDGLEIAKCLWVDEMFGTDIAVRWGLRKYEGDTKSYDVIQYIDDKQMTVIVDDKVEAFSIDNVLGFVPVVCIGNIGVPGTPFGDTDVEPGIPLSDEINYRMALEDEQAAGQVNPIIIAKGGSIPENLAIGQGGRIETSADGSVELLGPLPIPASFFESMKMLERWYDAVTDNPAALRGESMGNIISGKGFNAMLSPMTARLQIRRSLIDPSLVQVNRYMMEMWWKFPKFKDAPLRLSGRKGRDFFTDEFSAEEFLIDGKMYTENEVFLSPQSYLDRQGTDVELMQLYQNELISWDTVVENLPYVQNKARERRRIEKDRQWKAEGMAMAQQMANSSATANPDLGAQERTNYGLERGFMGEMGAPPMPEASGGAPGPMPGAPAEAGSPPPEEGPELIDAIVEVFAGIPKLKGKVWIGGDVLLDPEAMGGEDWSITVWVELGEDKATIVNHIKQSAPELYGHLKFNIGAPGGDEPTVQVVGGEEMPEEPGPEAMPEMPGMPPGGMMPGMM